MGESTIRLSSFQIDAINTRFYIEGIPKLELIKANLCKLCGLAAVCSQYTNGSPFITLPANQVDKYTLKELDTQRSCNKL